MTVATADLPFVRLYELTKAFEDIPASSHLVVDTRQTGLEVGSVYLLELATVCTPYRVPETGLDLPVLEHPVGVVGKVVRVASTREI